MKRTTLYFLILLLILIFVSSFFWLYEAKYFIGRASISTTTFSIDNSYLFISPLKAKANGQEKIRITVFVLNNQGLGVLGKKVEIDNDKNLKIEITQGLTDNFGKAVFDISSNMGGEYYLEVKVDGKALSQKAHLSFD